MGDKILTRQSRAPLLNGHLVKAKIEAVDLLATCTLKGWRNTSGGISGNGTDPNWNHGLPVEIRGQTKITCSLQGYSTVAAIMYYTSEMNILSYITGTTVLSAADIPSGAAYVAICCRNQQSWPGQHCTMY